MVGEAASEEAVEVGQGEDEVVERADDPAGTQPGAVGDLAGGEGLVGVGEHAHHAAVGVGHTVRRVLSRSMVRAPPASG